MFGFSSRRTLAAVAAASVAIAGVSITALPAAASPASHSALPSEIPGDLTPHVLDGRVESVIQVGGKTILGGVFTQVQNPDRSQTFDRENLLAFDTATGEIDPNLSYDFNNDVYDLVPAADGKSFYVAGAFWKIDGKNEGRLARIDAETGQVMQSFASPGFDNRVYGVERRGDTLYVGGSFVAAGGEPRTLMASVDAATGALTDEMNLVFSDVWSGSDLRINDFVVTPDGSKLYAAGNFRNVGGQPRSQIVQIDLTGPTASVGPWTTSAFTSRCATKFDGYIKDLDISDDGTWFAAATTGAFSGGYPATLCDSASRWEVNESPNQSPTWVNYSGGDTLTKISIAGDVLYLGGHQRWVNNPYKGDAPGPGSIEREGVSAHDIRNGMPYSWDPGRARGVGVYEFLPTADGLWVGSDTDRIGPWADREKIAFLPMTGGGSLPEELTPELPGEILGLGASGATAWEATPTSVGDARSIGSGIDWTGTRAATVIDDVLYYATSGGTMLARDVAADSFGEASNIDLLGLVEPLERPRNFQRDLAEMGSMFFERDSGRMYYTVAGTTRLFYRYFTTESASIGAVRYEVSTAATPVDWASVRGAFLSDGWLYYGSTDGQLRRVGWTGTGVTGTASVVSGPSVDGKNWSGLALTAIAPAPNGKPSAVAEVVSCDGLSCEFDGSGSSDPEDEPLTFEWSFGGGQVASGVSASYTFGSAGTFEVSLTVTDVEGASSTDTVEVVVREPVSGPALVGSSQANGATAALSVPVPGQVQDGDVMVLLVAANQNSGKRTLSAPPGWTSLGVRDDATMQSAVWWRSASAGDGGSDVVVASSSRAKLNAQLLVYAGVSGAPVAISAAEPKWTASHVSPVLEVPGGALVLSYWADKSAGTTSWTVPDSVVLREQNVEDQSSGSVSSVSADSDGPVAAGEYGGLAAVASTANGRATMWTIALPTDAPAPNGRPSAVADVVSCDGLSCEFDASGSSDPEGEPLTFEWSFGGGQVAAGVSASHTFGSAGTFEVSLTVTDVEGASSTDTVEVVVREPVSGPALVGSSQANEATAALSVPVPGQVQDGDVMVLLVAANQNSGKRTLSAPPGWTSLGVRDDATMQSAVWWRSASAGDGGSDVVVSSSSRAKLNAQLLVYAGVSGAPVAVSAAESKWTASHISPVLEVPGGALVLSYWADKSAGTTSWTVPDSVVLREQNVEDQSSGSVSSVSADSDGPVAAGEYGGLAAVASTANGRATMWTIALPTS